MNIVATSPVKTPGLQYLSPCLVNDNLVFDFLQIFLFHVTEIAFVSEGTECRHVKSGGKRCRPQGLVIRTCGHMSTDRIHGISIAVSGLSLHAVQRIRVITGPDLREKAQDAQIKPIAAGGTALKENFRKTLHQLSHHTIQSHDVAVRHFPLVRRIQIRGIIIRENAVHIPFHIGDVGTAKHLCHGLNDIITHLRISQIQNALVSPLRMRFSRNFHHPVRMLPVQITVHIDHLRLHPDAEIQPKSIDFLTKTIQSVGKLLRIYLPVTQRAPVIIPLSKPPVIHDKQLNAHILSGLGQAEQFCFTDIKVRCLPAV